jgi:cytochrome c peroxidase
VIFLDYLAKYSTSFLQNTTGIKGQHISLSANEKVDLVAFLLTLTDKEFLFNKDFSFPSRLYENE